MCQVKLRTDSSGAPWYSVNFERQEEKVYKGSWQFAAVISSLMAT